MTMDHKNVLKNWMRLGACWLAVISVAGCTLTPNRAPVEDHGPSPRPPASGIAPTVATVEPAKPVLPGAENLGKPGYYTVKPGDTLVRIGLDNGQSWKDLVKWNSLDNPNNLAGLGERVAAAEVDPWNL